MAASVTVSMFSMEHDMTIAWQICLPSERVEVIKKQLTWISLAIACSIVRLVSVKALASKGLPIVKICEYYPRGYWLSSDYCVPRGD